MKVSELISAKTGLQPANIIALTVAANVLGGKITSQFCFRSRANNDKCRADVPELTVAAY